MPYAFSRRPYDVRDDVWDDVRDDVLDTQQPVKQYKIAFMHE